MKRSYPFETNDQDMDIERDKKRPRHKYQIEMIGNKEIYEKIIQLETRILRLETLLKNTYQSIYNFCKEKNNEGVWNFYIS